MVEDVRLKIVDGLDLAERHREVLRPGELMKDRQGRGRRLPRFFYEVPSWEVARDTRLTPNFALWEFLNVDVREQAEQRDFPRYVPCAVTLLAGVLELFRERVDTFVHIAANGGYRSPRHRLTEAASPHLWGTAANIYRIGDEYLNERERIERYNRMAEQLLPGIWVRPYGHASSEADDHVHIDIGYVTVVPREAASEEEP